ncbi:hypothetical protein [Clostridium felsineum]|nr:hypothetical protein [Clostridium felsineum]URZ01933.1 hypothetical protein CLAUR_019300 [Clostridium felsineum]
MAKINVSKCEVFEETTLEFDIENVIYNFILGKIKKVNFTEDKEA